MDIHDKKIINTLTVSMVLHILAYIMVIYCQLNSGQIIRMYGDYGLNNVGEINMPIQLGYWTFVLMINLFITGAAISGVKNDIGSTGILSVGATLWIVFVILTSDIPYFIESMMNAKSGTEVLAGYSIVTRAVRSADKLRIISYITMIGGIYTARYRYAVSGGE